MLPQSTKGKHTKHKLLSISFENKRRGRGPRSRLRKRRCPPFQCPGHERDLVEAMTDNSVPNSNEQSRQSHGRSSALSAKQQTAIRDFVTAFGADSVINWSDKLLSIDDTTESNCSSPSSETYFECNNANFPHSLEMDEMLLGVRELFQVAEARLDAKDALSDVRALIVGTTDSKNASSSSEEYFECNNDSSPLPREMDDILSDMRVLFEVTDAAFDAKVTLPDVRALDTLHAVLPDLRALLCYIANQSSMQVGGNHPDARNSYTDTADQTHRIVAEQQADAICITVDNKEGQRLDESIDIAIADDIPSDVRALTTLQVLLPDLEVIHCYIANELDFIKSDVRMFHNDTVVKLTMIDDETRAGHHVHRNGIDTNKKRQHVAESIDIVIEQQADAIRITVDNKEDQRLDETIDFAIADDIPSDVRALATLKVLLPDLEVLHCYIANELDCIQSDVRMFHNDSVVKLTMVDDETRADHHLYRNGIDTNKEHQHVAESIDIDIEDLHLNVENVAQLSKQIETITHNALPNGWTCPTCTFINMPFQLGCEICAEDPQNDDDVAAGPIADPATQFNWTSKESTLINETTRPDYEICESPHNDEDDDQDVSVAAEQIADPTTQSSWTCPECTFINETTRPGCEICSTARPEAGGQHLLELQIDSSIATSFTEIEYDDDHDVSVAAGPSVDPTTQSSWTCPDCTFKNETTRPGCEICSKARPEAGGHDLLKLKCDDDHYVSVAAGPFIDPAAQSGWTCPECTFINETTRPGCEICSTARPEAGGQHLLKLRCDSSFAISFNDIECDDDHDVSVAAGMFIDPATQSSWTCPECTFINETTRPGCAVCSKACPKAGGHGSLLSDLLTLQSENSIAKSYTDFECPVCFDAVGAREGAVLSGCLHSFCRECLVQTVLHSDQSDVRCPFTCDDYSCVMSILDSEIRALLSDVQYTQYMEKSLSEAEKRLDNTFHCKMADCPGWCTHDDQVTEFTCPVCSVSNCIACKVIHQGLTCVAYNEGIRDEEDSQMLKKVIDSGDIMHCPKCQILVTKMSGCDYLVCSACQIDICWATRGPRWGERGHGDTTGGCRCGLNGQRCHPNCGNCH